eukprot:gene1057-1144_t
MLRRVVRPNTFKAFTSSSWNGIKQAPAFSHLIISHRNFSATSSPPTDNLSSSSSSSLTDALTNTVLTDPTAVDLTATAASALATGGGLEEVGFAFRHVMLFLDNLHTMAGIPYWEAIVLTTIGLRVCLLPVVLKTVQGSARMALMRPDMQKVQDRMKEDSNLDDPNVKLRYQQEMKALFAKYKVNPLRAVLWPMFQLPIFIAFFVALREMGQYFPGMTTGGAYWFSDLTASDAYYVLPILNSLSFLLMFELGSDGMQMGQQGTFKTVMRGMSVAMVPLTASMPQGVFVYWISNNFFSLGQTYILKNKKLRELLDIPEPPKDAPVFKPVNPIKAIAELIEKEKSKGDDAKAEILEGVKAAAKPDAPKPVVFDHRPPVKKSS